MLNILKRRTDDEDVKRHAIAYMEQTGSFGYTRQVVRCLIPYSFVVDFSLIISLF